MLVLTMDTQTDNSRIIIGNPDAPIGVIELTKIVSERKTRIGFEGFHDIPIIRERTINRAGSRGLSDDRPGPATAE